MKRTAAVTGGTGGIGDAVCRQLAQEGWEVIVCCRSAEEKARTLAKELGGRSLRFDVSDRRQTESSLGAAGQIDLLVNCAGISYIETFDRISPEKASSIIETDLIGAMNCARTVLPGMISRKSGGIINISSMWGQVGASCEVDYSAAKAGLIGFTKALAKECAPSGIRVNCVSPGFIMTEMNSSFSPEDLELIRQEIPLGVFGEPRHVADAVAFLASDKAEYITGQVLAVNGGMVI
ncbi:MAG: 3-oxoacyl-ACP reductase FabG [Ruminococcus sp.]|nr:3-oxoacyl-ACP reductase FabG [Ruminococcus sp.]